MHMRHRALAAPLSVAAIVAGPSVAQAQQPAFGQGGQQTATNGEAAKSHTNILPAFGQASQQTAKESEATEPQTNVLPAAPPPANPESIVNPRPPRGVSVLDRKRTDFDPDGATLGTYTIYPSFHSTVGVTDNIYKQPQGQSALYAVNRFDLRLSPPATAYQISADGYAQQSNFSQFSDNDTFTYRAHIGLRGAVTPDLIVRANAVRERLELARAGVGEVVNNLRPTRFGRTGLDASIRNDFQRFSLQASYAYGDFRFLSNIDSVGAQRSERARNFKRHAIDIRAGFSLSKATEAFALVSHERRQFSLVSSPVRDVDITKAIVGIEGDITPVIHGRIGAGVLRTNFKSAAIKDDYDVTFDMELNFFLTDLTTVSVTGQRELINVANAASAAALGTSVAVRVDHELYRNVVLSAEATYSDANYINSDAHAKAYSLDGGARWLISKRVHLLGSIRAEGRNTNNFNLDRDFTSYSATVGIQIAL